MVKRFELGESAEQLAGEYGVSPDFVRREAEVNKTVRMKPVACHNPLALHLRVYDLVTAGMRRDLVAYHLQLTSDEVNRYYERGRSERGDTR